MSPQCSPHTQFMSLQCSIQRRLHKVKLHRGAEGTIEWKLATLWTLFCYLIGLKGDWMDTNIQGWYKSKLLPTLNFKSL